MLPKNSIFRNPLKYRSDIRRNFRLSEDIWKGQSYVVVFPTKYCPVGCSHCYFASPKPRNRVPTGSLSKSDTSVVSSFVSDADTELLQITGGGEPLLELNNVLSLIRSANCKRLLLNTSGIFARSTRNTVSVIQKLFSAFEANPFCSRFTFRLSVDDFHFEQMNRRCVENIVNVFRKNNRRFYDAGFVLKFHTLVGDSSVEKFISEYRSELISVGHKEMYGSRLPVSIEFTDGFTIEIGYAQRMFSNAAPDLNASDKICNAVTVFDEIRDPNPGLFLDSEGRPGMCFVIHESGSVELWNTAPSDNIPNVRSSSFAEVKDSVLSDVIQVAALDRSALYVESIINEVDPLSLRRSKAIGSATFLNKNALIEARLCLFVSLRVIQDYSADGLVIKSAISKLHPRVIEALQLSKADLIEMYSCSDNDLLDDYINDPTTTTPALINFYESLEKGHFEIRQQSMIERVRESDVLSDELKSDFARATMC